SLVEAQQARITAQALSVVRDNGAEQITLGTRPAGDGQIQVFDRNGDPGIQIGTGGNAGGAVPAANISTFNVLAPPSAGQQGPIAQLGMAADNGPDPNAPALTLNDRQGNARVFETVSLADGSPSVALRDPNNIDRVRLSTGPGVKSTLAVLDANGVDRLDLSTGGENGTRPEGEGLNVLDSNGKEMARIGTGLPGTTVRATLRLDDSSANPRLVLSVADDGTPSIQLLDANGNVTWSAS